MNSNKIVLQKYIKGSAYALLNNHLQILTNIFFLKLKFRWINLTETKEQANASAQKAWNFSKNAASEKAAVA